MERTIDLKDLKIDMFSGGCAEPPYKHFMRVTHLPTGKVVTGDNYAEKVESIYRLRQRLILQLETELKEEGLL